MVRLKALGAYDANLKVDPQNGKKKSRSERLHFGPKKVKNEKIIFCQEIIWGHSNYIFEQF